MKKVAMVGGILAGGICGLALLAYLWSLNYAGLYLALLKSAAVWSAFKQGDVFAPLQQAWTYAADGRIAKLTKLALMLTLMEGVVLAGLAYLFVARPFSLKMPTDGSRLATKKDLEKAGMFDGQPGKSIFIGTFEGKPVWYKGDSHFYVNGPSRSGKGRGFVMPNLLQYEGSAIVLDVKQENWELTAQARIALGQQVFLFAPGSRKSHRWNPLDSVRSWPERATDLLNLAASLIPIGDKEEPYWKQTARGLFAGILGYVLESKTMAGRRHLRSALRLFSTGRNFSDVVVKILDTEPDLNTFIVDAFRQHLARDPEQRPSFENHIITSLGPWNNHLMASATSTSDFDITQLRRKPFSLFLGAPVSDFGTVEPILRLLIQQIHDLMLRALPAEDERHQVLLMIDEFFQMERLPEIVRRAPLVAGYGLRIAIIAQGISQIDERYGPKAREALLTNMDLQVYIAFGADGKDGTATVVSQVIGRHYVEREGWGSNSKGFAFGRRASQGRFELVPILSPDALQRFDDEKILILVRGSYAAILDKPNFYTDERFVKRRTALGKMKIALPIPELNLISEWPLEESRQMADRAPGTELAAIKNVEVAGTSLRELASVVYADPQRFIEAAETAIAAADKVAVAKILYELRTSPDVYGLVRGNLAKLGKGKLERRAAAEAIWPLRKCVEAGYRAVIDRQAQAFRALGADVVNSNLAMPLPVMPSPAAEQLSKTRKESAKTASLLDTPEGLAFVAGLIDEESASLPVVIRKPAAAERSEDDAIFGRIEPDIVEATPGDHDAIFGAAAPPADWVTGEPALDDEEADLAAEALWTGAVDEVQRSLEELGGAIGARSDSEGKLAAFKAAVGSLRTELQSVDPESFPLEIVLELTTPELAT